MFDGFHLENVISFKVHGEFGTSYLKDRRLVSRKVKFLCSFSKLGKNKGVPRYFLTIPIDTKARIREVNYKISL